MEMTLHPRLVDLYRICRNKAYVPLHPQKKNPILVLEQASRVQSSSLYQEYRSWCQRMVYSMRDDKQFKASMLRIEGCHMAEAKLYGIMLGLDIVGNPVL